MRCQLQYQTWDDRPISIDLKPGRYRIGRQSDNDIVIDELAVAGKHCLITVEPQGGMHIQDLDSVQGVYLDGAPVDAAELMPGQTVHLGTFMVKIVASERGNRSTDVISMESVALSDGSFSCLTHRDRRALYECTHCHHLFCDACLPAGATVKQAARVCPSCGQAASAIDWSGLTMTSQDAAYELLPDSLKNALAYWNKLKGLRNDSDRDKSVK